MAVLGFGGGFRDVRQWYTRIATLERRVCLLEWKEPRQPLGTAFLVGPDLLLTTTHSIDRNRADLTGIGARFGYAVMETGEVQPGESYALAAKPVALSPVDEVDTVVLRLEQDVGARPADGTAHARGWVDLTDANVEPAVGSSIAIFQHADGGPLKVAMDTDSVIGFDDSRKYLLYRTDTLPGASGSPCFDIDWRLVAMHRGRSFDRGNHNHGVPFVAIQQWLERVGVWAQVNRQPPKVAVVAIGAAGLPDTTPFGLDSEIKRVLNAEGESQRLELKVHPFDDDAQGARAKVSPKLLGTIAAFMNSKVGGTVLIGVGDDRKFAGIEDHYKRVNPQRANWDAFALWLAQVIQSRLDGATPQEFFSLVRYHEQGHDICAIHVEPAPSPVFIDGELYVRSGNRNAPYRGHDLLAYVVNRWSWLGSRAPTSALNQPPPADSTAHQGIE